MKRKRKLESPREIIHRLDNQDFCEEMQEMRGYLRTFVDEMDRGMTQVERLLNEARQCSMRATFLAQNCLVR